MFITGFLAIGYEIIWLRVVGVLVKASPYVFSSVLSVYLLGIGLGSYGMARVLRRQTLIGKQNLFFPKDGHWTAPAIEFVSQEVAKHIVKVSKLSP